MTWTNDDVRANLPTIKKHVTQGLAVGGLKDPKDPKLHEIVVLDPSTGDFASYVQFTAEATDSEPEAFLVEPELQGIWQLVYHKTITLGPRLKPEFGQGVIDEAKKWAESVRTAELKWVLTRICEESHDPPTATALDPEPLTSERVLILDSSLDSRFDKLKVRWSTDHPGGPGATKVVVYEADDPRPVITRLQDFELTGLIDSNQKLKLTLTAIVMLRNFGAGYRHKSLVPAPPVPAPPTNP